MRCKVFAQFTFEAIHCWPDAVNVPGVEFLANPHRHQFHVRVECPVSHTDRDREFILMKREARSWCVTKAEDPETITWSCEAWAQWLMDKGQFSMVEVSEDGENGAVVW